MSKKMNKETNNDDQNTSQKAEYWAKQHNLKTGGELGAPKV